MAKTERQDERNAQYVQDIAAVMAHLPVQVTAGIRAERFEMATGLGRTSRHDRRALQESRGRFPDLSKDIYGDKVRFAVLLAAAEARLALGSLLCTSDAGTALRLQDDGIVRTLKGERVTVPIAYMLSRISRTAFVTQATALSLWQATVAALAEGSIDSGIYACDKEADGSVTVSNKR